MKFKVLKLFYFKLCFFSVILKITFLLPTKFKKQTKFLFPAKKKNLH